MTYGDEDLFKQYGYTDDFEQTTPVTKQSSSNINTQANVDDLFAQYGYDENKNSEPQTQVAQQPKPLSIQEQQKPVVQTTKPQVSQELIVQNNEPSSTLVLQGSVKKITPYQWFRNNIRPAHFLGDLGKSTANAFREESIMGANAITGAKNWALDKVGLSKWHRPTEEIKAEREALIPKFKTNENARVANFVGDMLGWAPMFAAGGEGIAAVKGGAKAAQVANVAAKTGRTTEQAAKVLARREAINTAVKKAAEKEFLKNATVAQQIIRPQTITNAAKTANNAGMDMATFEGLRHGLRTLGGEEQENTMGQDILQGYGMGAAFGGGASALGSVAKPVAKAIGNTEFIQNVANKSNEMLNSNDGISHFVANFQNALNIGRNPKNANINKYRNFEKLLQESGLPEEEISANLLEYNKLSARDKIRVDKAVRKQLMELDRPSTEKPQFFGEEPTIQTKQPTLDDLVNTANEDVLAEQYFGKPITVNKLNKVEQAIDNGTPITKEAIEGKNTGYEPNKPQYSPNPADDINLFEQARDYDVPQTDVGYAQTPVASKQPTLDLPKVKTNTKKTLAEWKSKYSTKDVPQEVNRPVKSSEGINTHENTETLQNEPSIRPQDEHSVKELPKKIIEPEKSLDDMNVTKLEAGEAEGANTSYSKINKKSIKESDALDNGLAEEVPNSGRFSSEDAEFNSWYDKYEKADADTRAKMLEEKANSFSKREEGLDFYNKFSEQIDRDKVAFDRNKPSGFKGLSKEYKPSVSEKDLLDFTSKFEAADTLPTKAKESRIHNEELANKMQEMNGKQELEILGFGRNKDINTRIAKNIAKVDKNGYRTESGNKTLEYLAFGKLNKHNTRIGLDQMYKQIKNRIEKYKNEGFATTRIEEALDKAYARKLKELGIPMKEAKGIPQHIEGESAYKTYKENLNNRYGNKPYAYKDKTVMGIEPYKSDKFLSDKFDITNENVDLSNTKFAKSDRSVGSEHKYVDYADEIANGDNEIAKTIKDILGDESFSFEEMSGGGRNYSDGRVTINSKNPVASQLKSLMHETHHKISKAIAEACGKDSVEYKIFMEGESANNAVHAFESKNPGITNKFNETQKLIENNKINEYYDVYDNLSNTGKKYYNEYEDLVTEYYNSIIEKEANLAKNGKWQFFGKDIKEYEQRLKEFNNRRFEGNRAQIEGENSLRYSKRPRANRSIEDKKQLSEGLGSSTERQFLEDRKELNGNRYTGEQSDGEIQFDLSRSTKNKFGMEEKSNRREFRKTNFKSKKKNEQPIGLTSFKNSEIKIDRPKDIKSKDMPIGLKGIKEPNLKATKYQKYDKSTGLSPKEWVNEVKETKKNYGLTDSKARALVKRAANEIKTTSDETERLLIKRGIITEEQAANRKKMVGSSTYIADNPEYTSDGKIDLTRTYEDLKEGVTGKREHRTVKNIHLENAYKNTQSYNAQAKYMNSVMDYVEKEFAKPIENGRVLSGYKAVNSKLLSNAIFGRYSKQWYETIYDGPEAISKAFKDEKVAKAWEELHKRTNTPDMQIPEEVYNSLFSGKGESAADWISRYGSKHPFKSFGKLTSAVHDAMMEKFKQRVLTSASFVMNNRIGNQIMIAAKSDNPGEYIKSLYDAFKIKNSDLPAGVLESNINNEIKSFNIRKKYTGYAPLDNAFNLFGGQLLDTSTLKGMKKISASTLNWFVGKPARGFAKWSDKVMRFNQKFEDFERRQVFAKHINKERRELVKRTGQKMITQQEFVDQINKNSPLREAIIEDIQNTLGDYNNFSKFEKDYLKRVVPFYSWYRTISRHTYQLAKKNPTRAALIMYELDDIKNNSQEDLKEYQRGSIRTGKKNTLTGENLVINKMHAMPYMTFREDLGVNPFIQVPAEALRGKKFFQDQEISNKRYARFYSGKDEKYYDTKTKKTLDKLPVSTRLGYVGKQLLWNNALPYLDNPMLDVNKTAGLLANKLSKDDAKVDKGKWHMYDKSYDATILGGFNIGDKVGTTKYTGKYGQDKEKEIKRSGKSRYSNGVALLNRGLGLSIQNENPSDYFSEKEEKESLSHKLSVARRVKAWRAKHKKK